MSDAAAWAARLAGGAPIAEPVAVVVAHPDDETLWTGALLARLSNATLIVLTDGAPEDMGDAHRLGFATREAYARARVGELDRALDALGFAGRLIRYEVPDQQAVHNLAAIAARLAGDLAGAPCVVTHPYEGGHPDHDAAACAVSRAGAPATVEFACYAQFDGQREFARFVTDTEWPGLTRLLDPAERSRVANALAEHRSQSSVFGDWRPTHERWRPAPRYRFDRPPPGEACLYDGFGWSLTSARWREHARTP